MKILIITQVDPFYIPIFFKRFFEIFPYNDFEIDSVIILPPFNRKLLKLVKRMHYFYGTWGFLKQGTKYVFLKIMNKLHIVNNSIERLSNKRDVPVYHINKINDPELVMELKNKGIDIILSVAASQIFKEPLLEVPKWGCINIHSAKLPKYRGMMPNFWTMLHDEKTAGITVHTMDVEIDKGKILKQIEIPIEPGESLELLIKKSKHKGAELVVEALVDIKNAQIEYKDYKGDSSYFSFPKKEHLKQFRDKGLRVL